MTITEFLFVKWGRDAPEGWTLLADQPLTHHHHYGRWFTRQVTGENE